MKKSSEYDKKANWFTRLKPVRKAKLFWEHYQIKKEILKIDFDIPTMVYWHVDKDFVEIVYRIRGINEGTVLSSVMGKAVTGYVDKEYAQKDCPACGKEL